MCKTTKHLLLFLKAKKKSGKLPDSNLKLFDEIRVK